MEAQNGLGIGAEGREGWLVGARGVLRAVRLHRRERRMSSDICPNRSTDGTRRKPNCRLRAMMCQRRLLNGYRIQHPVLREVGDGEGCGRVGAGGTRELRTLLLRFAVIRKLP